MPVEKAEPMLPLLATIHIKDLRLRTFIGFNEEEKVKKQDVVLNISLQYDATDSTRTDAVADACNYKILTKQIIALVENNSYSLLEKMAADIIAVIDDFDPVLSARVEIDKPHALRFADSVAVTMEYTRD
jgi:D-erythro-7,8-dihydroneopterin triphosphate epimerase